MTDSKNKIFSFIRFIVIVAALVSCGITAHSKKFPAPESDYLDSVDYYLKNAQLYTSQAFADIRSQLKELDKMAPEERLEPLAAIGQRLEQIDIDSAMVVYSQAENLAQTLGNERYIHKFRYRKGSVMPMMGLVREGIETFSSVTPDERDKFDYFTTGHHIFDAAVDFYRVDSIQQKYKYLSQVYNDSALAYVSPGSIDELYYKALPKLTGKDRMNGIAELNDVLQKVSITDPLFAKAAAEIASAYSSVHDTPNVKYYLALSAIGDLRAGTREATSLHRLGKLLNNEDDYARAYDYLAYALDAAVASGSVLRTIEIGEIMPDVVKAGRQLEHQRNQTLIIIVILLSCAVIVFLCILIYATRTRDRLHKMQKQLVGINDSKDLYIRKLISLCGAYLSALENFNKLAGRKIKVGQLNELLAMIESGKVIREQLQSFYEVFDDAFLAVYPDFVDRVNSLLLPDQQLSLNEDERLGTELRIVAFMRLGLDDSNQIAKFLGLSLNTIYTYRNKVKNRAIHRATFEDDVKNIGRAETT